jgi:hypothetical protein
MNVEASAGECPALPREVMVMPAAIYAPHWHSSPPPSVKTPILPQTRVGWWALLLLLATGPFPFYWATLDSALTGWSLGGEFLLPVLASALAIAAFGLGYVAIVRRRDWSFILTTIFAVVAVEVVFGLIIWLTLSIGASGT